MLKEISISEMPQINTIDLTSKHTITYEGTFSYSSKNNMFILDRNNFLNYNIQKNLNPISILEENIDILLAVYKNVLQTQIGINPENLTAEIVKVEVEIDNNEDIDNYISNELSKVLYFYEQVEILYNNCDFWGFQAKILRDESISYFEELMELNKLNFILRTLLSKSKNITSLKHNKDVCIYEITNFACSKVSINDSFLLDPLVSYIVKQINKTNSPFAISMPGWNTADIESCTLFAEMKKIFKRVIFFGSRESGGFKSECIFLN